MCINIVSYTRLFTGMGCAFVRYSAYR